MRAAAQGVELEYETFGDRDDPALLLIAGYAMQLIFWDVELCEMLADRGLFVIRFDNRDCGLSTHLGAEPYPVVQAMTDRLAGVLDGKVALARAQPEVRVRHAPAPSSSSMAGTSPARGVSEASRMSRRSLAKVHG
jgi:pimeloyl-ACP methyl ester carboxylesterase